MKVNVRIDGYIDVDYNATEQEIKDSIYFQLGYGSMAIDNAVGEPVWDYVDVEVNI